MSANIAEQVTEGAANALTFVINLCASTSPMALTHPSTPELKKFTFFVTRQREDGRERFRLHMGYFPTQQAAEALLASVRDIYPAAWAGPAPSSVIPPRRVRADATASMPAPSFAPSATSATSAPNAPPAVAAPAVAAPVNAAAPKRPPAPSEPVLDAMSNVRDVLALLGDTTPKPIPAPVMPGPPVAVPRVAPPVAAAPRPAPVATPAPAPAPAPTARAPLAPPKSESLVAKVAPPAAKVPAPAPVAPTKPVQALECARDAPCTRACACA